MTGKNMAKIPLILSLFLGNSCSLINDYPDNPVEEFIEDEIQKETGVKIDFTGSSVEPVKVTLNIPI